MAQVFQRPLLALVLSTMAVALGCGGGDGDRATPPIETLPVQGKVQFKGGAGGTERLDGGKVWFKSTLDANLTAVGSITEDGSFTMTTLFPDKGSSEGKAFSGVPAGTYKVRVEPPPDDDEAGPRRGLLHPKYLDYDKSGITVTVPLTAELTIVVERPRR